MEPWQGQLLRKQYGRKDWPTLGSMPMTLTSVLVHSMEPLTWPCSLMATQVADAAHSTDTEARAQRGAVT